MQIDLNQLRINDRFSYDDDFEIDSTIYQKEEIKGLTNLHVKGSIYYNSAEILEINLFVSGVMKLEDSVSLELIEHPFEIEIAEEYSLNDSYFKEYYEKEQNILDIIAILWENIVLEVPMRLTKTKNKTIHGEGWQLGDKENKEDIDPRLAKLAELLDERKE